MFHMVKVYSFSRLVKTDFSVLTKTFEKASFFPALFPVCRRSFHLFAYFPGVFVIMHEISFHKSAILMIEISVFRCYYELDHEKFV